jgi:hypothetical protein
MTWGRLDDKAHSHPKLVAAGNAAVGLWTRLRSWALDQLTDGYVPECVARMFDDANGEQTQRLVQVGLLESAPDGYALHDFTRYNPSARKTAKTRKARQSAGVRGAESRWQNDGKPHGKHDGKTIAEACPRPNPNPIPIREDPAVDSVWSHFLLRRSESGKSSPLTLTPKRRAQIRARLTDSTEAELRLAVDGLWSSKWHRDEGQTDPELVFRSRERVEFFLGKTDQPAQHSLPVAGDPMRCREPFMVVGACAPPRTPTRPQPAPEPSKAVS